MLDLRKKMEKPRSALHTTTFVSIIEKKNLLCVRNLRPNSDHVFTNMYNEYPMLK